MEKGAIEDGASRRSLGEPRLSACRSGFPAALPSPKAAGCRFSFLHAYVVAQIVAAAYHSGFMRVLAIDPSLRGTGFAILEKVGTKVHALTYGTIRNAPTLLPSG